MNKYDMKYIFKRVLVFFIIFIILSFIKSCKVNALSYSFQDYNGTIYFNPSGADITNSRQNTLYYHGGGYNPASVKAIGNICSNDTHMCDTLSTGTYLVDFWIYGVGQFYSSYSPNDFSTDFCWNSATDGTQHCTTTYSKSKTLEVRKEKFSSYDAIHLLIRWDVTDTYYAGVGISSFQVTKYNLFTQLETGSNIGYSIGGVFDYSPDIIENFRNGQQLSNIENAINSQSQQQHQDSLNEQNAINQNTQAQNQTNNLINDDNVSGANSEVDDLLQNSAFNDTSGINSIISIPLTFIQSLTSKTCRPLLINIPFMNEVVQIPCMQNYLHTNAPTLYTIIKTLVNGFVIYRVLLDIFHIVKNSRNPDDDRIEVLDL